jgi:lipoprotein-anchoring transpeptidase ErfK/SrfK
MRLSLAAFAPLCLIVGACSQEAAQQGESAPPASDANGADPLASNDAARSDQTIADPEQRPIMQMQVVLERLGFAPGVIDGKEGASLANAVKGFQEAHALPVTGTLDEQTRSALAQWDAIPATRVVTIPEEWGRIAFVSLPTSPAEQANLDGLGYESLAEKLAERFHTTPEVLAQLNPGGRPAGAGGAAAGPAAATPAPPAFAPGQQIRVPNVGADRIDAATIDDSQWLETLRSLGVGTDQPEVARIVVDESEGWLKAFDSNDKLVAMFTVTTGSRHDPLPIGNWGIKGKAYNPTYAYDPTLLRGAPDSDAEQQLPPGPNGPVGVVWIDLTKDHYGIHGTPSPETIGRAQSNGCVRLTNWDAARLALMASGSTKVEFRK